MKIKIDDNEIRSITDDQKKSILSFYHWTDFEKELKRRIDFVFIDIYTQCLNQLKSEWEQKLIDRGHEMLPVRLEAFAKLIFSQSDYRNRQERDQEAEDLKRVIEQSTAQVI